MLSVSLMKKHLIAFNKAVRKQFIISGVSKLKGDEVKKAFKDNLQLVKVGDMDGGEKVTKEFYVPYNTMTDIGYDSKVFKNLMPDKKESKKKTHTMPSGKVMTGAKHSKESVDFVKEYKTKFPDPPKKKAEPPKKTKADLLKLGEKYKEFLINQSYAGTNMTKYKNRYEEFIDEVKKDKIPNKFNTFDSAFKTFTRSFDYLIRKDKEEKAERTKRKEERKKKAEEELKKKKEEPAPKKKTPKSKVNKDKKK